MRAKVIILNEMFKGFPKASNFKIIEEALPTLKNGEFLVEAEYISVDPYIRLYSAQEHVGQPVLSEQVGKIIESKNGDYPVGKYVIGEFGWRTHTVATQERGKFFPFAPRLLPDYGEKLRRSVALGVLGMPGNTAYFCLLKTLQPTAGNTVVISSAAGAVGTHAGQIAKILGCHVVGITGSDQKGHRLVKEVGFDAFINYKNKDFQEKLIEATPNRVDCYFDNVGGKVSSAVLNRMNKCGRVAVCGSIATYNDEDEKASEVQTPVKIHLVRMEGFSVFRWKKHWNEGIEQNLEWIKENKLKIFETVTMGFENTGMAFIDMMSGGNFGKAIVQI